MTPSQQPSLDPSTYLENSEEIAVADKLLDKVALYLSKADREIIQKALCFANECHCDQRRRDGQLYITHPIAVADILADYKLDTVTIVSALLHDVLEDTQVSKQQIKKLFGKQISELVASLSKLQSLKYDKPRQHIDYLQRMLQGMDSEPRVILIKLADRHHNLSTIAALPQAKQLSIAKETRDIYAPIARRLGLYLVASDLLDLCLGIEHPQRADVLQSAISSWLDQQLQEARKEWIAPLIVNLSSALSLKKDEVILKESRRSISSVHTRQQRSKLSTTELLGGGQYRLVLPTEQHCYAAIQVIHKLLVPVVGQFRDYIASPKINGYRALHTMVLNKQNRPVLITVRTSGMHLHSKYGIFSEGLDKAASSWESLRLDMSKSDDLLLEDFQSDLAPRRLVVYLVGDARRNATMKSHTTALDFAFYTNPERAPYCTACIINGVTVLLNKTLASGNRVQFEYAEECQITPNWLQYVTLSRSKRSIESALQRIQHQDAVDMGHSLLQSALQNKDIEMADVPLSVWAKVLKTLKINDKDLLLEHLARGKSHPVLVAQLVATICQSGTSSAETMTDERQPIAVKGTEGLAVEYASCCKPVFGDTVTAIVADTIVIHRRTCNEVIDTEAKMEQTCTPVEWLESGTERRFLSTLRMNIINQLGQLDQVLRSLSKLEIDMYELHAVEREAVAECTLGVRVSDKKELQEVIDCIATVYGVHNIERIRPNMQ